MQPHNDTPRAVPWWLFALLGALLIFGGPTSPNAFFGGWSDLGGWGLLRTPRAVAGALALTAVGLTALLAPRRRTALALALLVTAQAAVALTLFSTTGGAALYHDDHPSFMYRLATFPQVFPRLVFYDPWWNAGVKDVAFVTSGILPLGLLFWPIWRWVPILSAYTPVLAFVFIGAAPWIVAGAVRLAGGGWAAAAIAGTLALGACRDYLVHLLHFGTVGSLLSSVLMVPAVVALHAVVWERRRDVRTVTVLVLASVVYLSWAGAALSAALVAGALALNVRRLLERRTLVVLGLCALVIAAVLAPVFLSAVGQTRAGEALTIDNEAPALDSLPARLGARLGSHLRQVNPLALVFGALGTAVLGGGWRAFLAPLLAALLLLASWGDFWHPTLQFTRLIIPFSLLACVPAGLLCGRLVESTGRRAAGALVLVLAAASGLAVIGHYRSLTGGPYDTLSPQMGRFIDWIRTETEPGERILFAGTTVHGYGGGHLALLPLLTGREMLAGDYYAFSPRMVETELPPLAWRSRGIAGVLAYLRLHRIGWCVTFHENWKAYFRRYPEHFQEGLSLSQTTLTITVFRVRATVPPLLEGEGSARPRSGGIDVRLDAPGAVVLPYRWVDGLTASDGRRVTPHDVDGGLRFIATEADRPARFTIGLR